VYRLICIINWVRYIVSQNQNETVHSDSTASLNMLPKNMFSRRYEFTVIELSTHAKYRIRIYGKMETENLSNITH